MGFKLDKTVFSSGKMSSQKPEKEYWRSISLEERFKAFIQMLSINYNFDPNNLPRLDRKVFSMDKRG